jgi:hypothetical protein
MKTYNTVLNGCDHPTYKSRILTQKSHTILLRKDKQVHKAAILEKLKQFIRYSNICNFYGNQVCYRVKTVW